jgi:hypothetical protein
VNRSAIAAAFFGVLPGVFTAVAQILRPGQRMVASHQLANSLRREGWDYASGRGGLPREDRPEALDTLLDEVTRIERVVELADETANEGTDTSMAK